MSDREFTVKECPKCNKLSFNDLCIHRGWDPWLESEFVDEHHTVERKAVLKDWPLIECGAHPASGAE